jgi:hypothetical protein
MAGAGDRLVPTKELDMPGIRPTPGDVLEVRTVCSNADQIAMNVLHYRVVSSAGPGPGVTCQDIAANLSNLVNAGYQVVMPASCAYRGTGVKNITPFPTQEFVSTGSAGPGVAGGTEVPQQVSYLVNFKTINSGRGFRGRIYPGFVTTVHVNSSGNMNAAGLTAIQLLASVIPISRVITAGGDSTTIQLVILRRMNGGVPLPPLSTADVITVNARNAYATQRRRGDYGRTNQAPIGF